MNRWDIGDAATLMTLLHPKRTLSLSRLLPGWDMLQCDVPSRERVEAALAILVGSGLAEVDSSWGMRLTQEGGQLRRSVKGVRGMREIPGLMSGLLEARPLSRAPLTLPQPIFEAAYDEYREAARRRAERRSRGRCWSRSP